AADSSVTTKERTTWARAIGRTVQDTHRDGWIIRGARPLTRPSVVAAATPALLAIEDALLDPRQHVSRATCTAIKSLLQDGATPRLCGDAPAAARNAAEVLRNALATPAPVGEPVAA